MAVEQRHAGAFNYNYWLRIIIIAQAPGSFRQGHIQQNAEQVKLPSVISAAFNHTELSAPAFSDCLP